MTDPFRPQKFYGIPHALRPAGFTGVNGDSPTSVPRFPEMLDEKRRGKIRFVAGKIERDQMLAMREQGIEFFVRDVRAVSAAQDPDQVHFHAGRSRAFSGSLDDRSDDCFRIESVWFGHEERAETQLQVVDPFALRVLDIFPGDAPAGIGVGEDAGHPEHLPDERHQAWLRLGDDHVRPQFLHGRRRQFYPVLLRQIEDGLESHTAIEMPVQIDERKIGIDERSVRHSQSARECTGELQEYSAREVRNPRCMTESTNQLGACWLLLFGTRQKLARCAKLEPEVPLI